MKVLFLTGEFPPMQGGVGDCTHEIACALAVRDVDVCVLTSATADSQPPTAENFQVLPIVRQWDWSAIRIIRDAIREFAPDILHIQYQTAAYGMHPAINFLPLWLKRRAPRVKIVFTYHDLKEPYLFPKAGGFRKFVTQLPARFSDAVIATNEEDFFSLAALRLMLLTPIPIGSNIPIAPITNYQLPELRRRLGVGDQETLLCYFGFLNESKGGETLIRALARVSNAKLLMLGGQVGASDPTNAAYLARVKKEIRDLRLEDRVLWTDYAPQETVTVHFYASDLCVLPYRDGASFRRGTLMAALAHGCAIVTTSPASPLSPQPPLPSPDTENQERGEGARPARGIGVRLRDGENCLLVSPDDPRALADAIQRAMQSRELREKIRAGARALARHFTWDRIAQQHLDLYRQVANGA